METIKLEIPLDPTLLLAASDYLRSLAEPSFTDDVTIDNIGEGFITPKTDEELLKPQEITAEQAFKASEELHPDVTQTNDAVSTVELDNDGLPWDARIHAGTKTKTKAGTWKSKRGVDPQLVVQVEQELREVMAIVPNEPVVTPDSEPVTPVTPIVPVEPTLVTPTISTLPELMAAITKAGKTPEEVNQVVTAAGLTSIVLLNARPDLIPNVVQQLGL